MTITIYHNPRCSKSRAALKLLEERGVEADVFLYLKTPPDAAAIKALMGQLGRPAHEITRRGEAAYKDAGLNADALESDVIAAMTAHPILIERPILVVGEKAVVGRPPEAILDLL